MQTTNTSPTNESSNQGDGQGEPRRIKAFTENAGLDPKLMTKLERVRLGVLVLLMVGLACSLGVNKSGTPRFTIFMNY